MLALEIATIKDATNHGWQTVIGTPSAALNGRLSDQARHLWYTFTHLAFAAIVPFALIYPSGASTAAHALQLYETCPQAPTGVTAKVKDLPMQVLQQGKQWSARIPSSLKNMAMCVSLIGLGLLASQIACTQPLLEKYDQEKDRSADLQTFLLVIGGFAVVKSALLVIVTKMLWDSTKMARTRLSIFERHCQECKKQCEACLDMSKQRK